MKHLVMPFTAIICLFFSFTTFGQDTLNVQKAYNLHGMIFLPAEELQNLPSESTEDVELTITIGKREYKISGYYTTEGKEFYFSAPAAYNKIHKVKKKNHKAIGPNEVSTLLSEIKLVIVEN